LSAPRHQLAHLRRGLCRQQQDQPARPVMHDMARQNWRDAAAGGRL